MTKNSNSSDPAYAFDHPHARPPRELTDLLGGKGAGLAEMTSVLGLPVPPGFTLTVDVCREHLRSGWPQSLDSAVRAHCERLEAQVGRKLGDPADPLLLAVRSGAPRSMPGMLDTVLNLGLNDETVDGLAKVSGSPEFAWDSYRRFLRMFATTVLGVPDDRLDLTATPADPLAEVARLRERIAEVAGRPVPTNPADQLRAAIEAVFRSWQSPRARAYRERENVPDDLGTAVNVQAMVFGNRDDRSGTGVVFTRDPSTGRDGPYGDYLPGAQGEDVVSGSAHTQPVTALAEQLPDVAAELRRHLRALELHYRDLCDVEFTVEAGRLWVLQTRVGKRGAVAAVRTAVALAEDPDIALTPAEAVARVPQEVRDKARAEVLGSAEHQDTGVAALTTGLGASPGRVCGSAVLDVDAALAADRPVILVRPETSPEDVAGMSVAAGILTGRGGLVSHAAVVARGWGIPAVVGAEALRFDGETVSVGLDGPVIRAGDEITIDGTTGAVWSGRLESSTDDRRDDAALLDAELPELGVLEQWAREIDVRPPE
ncbi:pyruvate, phosphate dikinase [Saccharopolyspora sp. WRP15-2]|uniref:Pyruvate, phosphate dikinase n=1 Tax=Saccharopolyspora oryzae TaxID=2997343 RepID=A0ABT4V4E4_9PSEU|nr:pyruvate, phosphate dikinase [Saccharopolyspora oryzae]MDA3628823.1 pyruvate, phosphate dikinase [Saccharopolyspora oryzae]